MIRLAVLVVLAQVAGCATSQPTPEPVPELGPPVLPSGEAAARPDALDEAMARWETAGFEAYQMTLRRSCFCPSPDYTGPFDVTVRDGEIEAVRLEGAEVDAERALTVGDLFDLLEEAYERGAVTVNVTFDPEAGYPTELYIDYDERMADEEIGYTVSDVEAL